MRPFETPAANNFQNFSMKRGKDAFHMSTAAFSTTRTTQRNENYNINNHNKDQQQTVRDRKHYQPFVDDKIFEKISIKAGNVDNLSNTQSFRYLSQAIKQSTVPQSPQVHTHSYFQPWLQQSESFLHPGSLESEQSFPPKIIKQMYDKELLQSNDGNICYHFGNLQKSGYMYFSIQNSLVFIKCSNFVLSDYQQQPIIINLDSHALCVKQIAIDQLEIQNLQRHPFGQKSIVFMIWSQWKVVFFSYQAYDLIKIKDLNMKYDTSCESSFNYDFCKNGDIYYLSEHGQLGKISLNNYSFNIFLLKKKLTIKQYFYRFKHSTKRKNDGTNIWGRNGFFSGLKQLILDIQYFWSEKKTKGISMICDRKREFVYTLVQTKVMGQGTDRLGGVGHRELRIYDVGEERNKGIVDKINAKVYNSPPKLISQITQQKMYSEICVHLFNNFSLQKFQFTGFYVPPPSHSTRSHPTNLVILLSNGSRLYLHISPEKMFLNEMINLPNLEEVLSQQQMVRSVNKNSGLFDKQSQMGRTIQQKQPVSVKVIQYQFIQNGTLVIICLYRKSIIGLMMSKGINSQNKEIVQLIFESPIQNDKLGSIFINYSQYKIYKCPELQQNIYKTKLSKHSLLSNSKISPEINQVLHYPRQELIIVKQKMKSILKLRPIDIVLGTLQQQFNLASHTNSQNLKNFHNHTQILSILHKLYSILQTQTSNPNPQILQSQLINILIQIYCDIDGVYYSQQFQLSSHDKKSLNNFDTVPRQGINYGNRNFQQNVGRMTESTLLYNFEGVQRNMSEFENQERSQRDKNRRLTQKFTFVNNFRKYRHSDLCTSLQTQPQRYSASPLKIKSDNSLMRFVEKLIIYLILNENKKIGLNQKLSKGQWIDGSEKQSIHDIKENLIKNEGSLVGFFARVLLPIWNTNIRQIEKQVYMYISQLCKKHLELIVRIQQWNPAVSFKSLPLLFTTILEYTQMLPNLTSFPKDTSFSSGLISSKQVFEKCLFLSLQKVKDLSSSVLKWREMFPNYFCLRLFKAVKLQAEINGLSKQKEEINVKKEIVIKNAGQMPEYLLSSYFLDCTLNRNQYEQLLEKYKGSRQVQALRIGELLQTCKGLDPLKRYQYLLSQVEKDSTSLSQKQILLTYTKKSLEQVRTLSFQTIQSKHLLLQGIILRLKIQQLIVKQTVWLEKQYKKNNNNGEFISENTKNLLNFYLLMPEQIKLLAKSLGSPFIDLLVHCAYDGRQNTQEVFRNIIFTIEGKIQSSKQVKKMLTEIFNIFEKDSTLKLPLNTILNSLDELCINQIEELDLTRYLSSNLQKVNTIPQTFWVPLFLSQNSYNKLLLLEHYTREMRRHFINTKLNVSKQFMYNWLSGYCLVKYQYIEGRRGFQVVTENILGRGAEGEKIWKQLIQFGRENLEYS